MSGHETHKAKPGIGLIANLEVATRHAASVGGGAVTATLSYLSGEAAYKTLGLISHANEAGLISESGGLSIVEAIKALGIGYAAFKSGTWTARMHHVARAIETGRRPTGKKH